MTASVAAIQRHPVKSHGREALAEVGLTAGAALPWDRTWAVTHGESKIEPGKWARCVNFMIASRTPRLMAIDARLDAATGILTLTHPDLPALSFRPDDPADTGRFVAWVQPLCPPERAQPAGILRVPDVAMTDTDYPSVSLISLASNAALGRHLGRSLSPFRWRANFWLDGLEPFAERDLVGRRMRIGTAELEITEPKVRCLATTANPETGERDADTLGALQAMFGDREFGVYARVVTGGAVRVGDRAEVLT